MHLRNIERASAESKSDSMRPKIKAESKHEEASVSMCKQRDKTERSGVCLQHGQNQQKSKLPHGFQSS